MICSFYDSFGKENKELRELPQEIIDELNAMLPDNFQYIMDDNGDYKVVPKLDKMKEGMEITTEIDLEKTPELGEKLKAIPREKWADYLYRTQMSVPIKSAQIGNKDKKIPIEMLSSNPLIDEETQYIDGWMKPDSFLSPMRVTFESPEGDVAEIDLQQQAYDSLMEIKLASVNYPALKIEVYQYSPLVESKAEGEHTSIKKQLVTTYSVIPSNAASVKEAVAALHIFRGLHNGTTKVNGKQISPEGATDEPKQVEEALQLWETALQLEEKLGVAFNPAAEFPLEDIRLFTELQTCLLENKEIIWRHPFDHFHVSGIHPVNENISFDDYIGKDSFRYEFYEGPIFVSLLGAEFNLFSRTRMDDFVMTNIVWDDGGREAAEVYISDAPDKQWTLSRLYITEDDMNKKPAQTAP